MRRKRLIYNTIFSILFEMTAIVCGFLLPRYLLQYYGTEINGLISSVTQFLGAISLMELGVGAVVQSTLYKPLADHNDLQISRILVSAKRFFRKIALFFCLYVVFIAVSYPFRVLDRFDYLYTFSLIVVIAVDQFTQYYFGITYQLLLTADQKAYVQLAIQIITMIANTVLGIVFMKWGYGIHMIKLSTTILYMFRPVLLSFYVKKKYDVDRRVDIYEEPIQQKWSGFAQHLAGFVLGGTDIIVLTLFSTLSNVSIYSIYYTVIKGVKQMILAFTRGQQALLGNMFVSGEKEILIKTFDSLEWFYHTITTIVFTCTVVLIVPFITVYTAGIHDANYILPEFSFLLTMANALNCLRLPYNMMVLAAGHYKQTQVSALIEMMLNIIISVIGVQCYGLIGVAVGTLVAILYKTVYLAWYLKKNILNRRFTIFLQHMLIDSMIFVCGYIASECFSLSTVSYLSWIWMAFLVTFGVISISLIFNMLIYRHMVFDMIQLIFSGKKIAERGENKR